ncbi:MAG: DNA internalization-related competence protein ComEC/Rec2 [Deltaproteobacteria bacterium]|nr:DNA internalization-related competence protein ComEC/Rec2 [Deltaproteobacteria bacterium]
MPKSSYYYARPLIPCLLALTAGIVAAVYLPGLYGIQLVVLFTVLSFLFFAWKGQRASLLPFLLFFVLGYCSLQSWVSPRLPANHVSHFVDDKQWHIIGTIQDDPQRLPGRMRFTLNAESLTRKGLSYKTRGAVQITIWGPAAGLCSGDRVACFVRLKEVRNFNNPGGFDYRRYLAFRGIRASASVSKRSHVTRLHPAKDWWLSHSIDRSRQRVSRLIEQAASKEPKEVQGIMKALLVGDRSYVSPKMRDVFSRIGTAHLLAISGLHIGIVASLAFFCFRFILSRSEGILLTGWCTKGAALLSLFPVVFYGLLAGMSPSTQRAVIMVVVFLVALLFERERDNLNTLALAALVILIINPTALFAISFQLSFGAVFAILHVVGHVGFARGLRQGPRSLFKRLALFMLVSAAAILGTVPITLYYFNQISLIGILTNCFMVPLIGFLTVPLGLLAILILPLSAAVSMWVMKGGMITLECGLGLAIFFSKWSVAAFRTITPTLIEIAVYYFLAWTLLNWGRTNRAKLVLIGLALVGIADVSYWVCQRCGCDELRMTAIDIGQGSSSLVELPGGPCVLVDGGGFYRNRFDVGSWIIGPFLWKRKVATVDILVLSHPDPDHLNGLLFIAQHFNVREVWMNLEPADTQPYRDFMGIISRKGIRVVGPQDLLRPRVINGVQFQVLYPPVDFLDRKSQETWRTPNNNSLVLKVSFQDISFLLPGDIEAEAERELSALDCQTLKCDLLLVPHHGSRSSSTTKFLECVDPDVAVVSSGWKNRFGFPHPKVVKRYKTLGCKVFRTDQQGAITITTDGKSLTVEPFLP